MKKLFLSSIPEVMKIKDFRVILLTRLCAMAAIISQDVIIGWQVYSLTHDVFMLGLTGLTEAVPALLCALFAGHIVDTSRPYFVFLIAIGVLAINSTFLMLIGGGHILVPGGILPWLFVGIFFSGLARAFTIPASFSLIPQIVSRERISSASAFLTSAFQLATVIAPAFAGLIYGGYGAQTAWYLPVMFIVMSFILLLVGMSHGSRHWRSPHRSESAVISIKKGFHFILTNKTLLSVMTLDMFAVLFGGAVAMLPAYADQVLGVGSEGLGALRAAPALGAIAIALILAVRPFEAIKGSLLLWVIVGFGVCMIAFGLSTNFHLSLFLLALSGGFDSISMVIRQTLMQWLTPDNMRGRISSVNSIFIISSNQIGSFESGTAARLMGLVPSVVFGGVCTLVVVAATALISPKLRKIVIKSTL